MTDKSRGWRDSDRLFRKKPGNSRNEFERNIFSLFNSGQQVNQDILIQSCGQSLKIDPGAETKKIQTQFDRWYGNQDDLTKFLHSKWEDAKRRLR